MNRNYKTGEPTPEEQLDDAVDIEEKDLVANRIELEGGRVDSLYSAYWSLLTAAKDACADPGNNAHKVAKGEAMRKFLEVTALYTEPPKSISSANSAAAFRSLNPQIQNLVMAVGEINKKISHHEEVLSEEMSGEYVKSARAAAACVLHICNQVRNIQGRKNERVNALWRNSVIDLLGHKYADFVKTSTNALQTWSETAKKISRLALEHPWISAFEAIRTSTDLSTPETISLALAGSRRQIEYVIEGLSAVHDEKAVQSDIKGLDERIGFRLQKHEISRQRYAEMSKAHASAEQLAEALKYLHLADSEIQTSLEAMENPPVIVKVPVDNRAVETLLAECRAQLPSLVLLIDMGHMLQSESTRLKSAISGQVVAELRMDVQSAMMAASACLKTCQDQQKRIYVSSLEKQSFVVRDLRAAERTLASEITHFLKGDGTSLEVCAKALAQTTRDRRNAMDVALLNEHKKMLHSLADAVRKALLTL